MTFSSVGKADSDHDRPDGRDDEPSWARLLNNKSKPSCKRSNTDKIKSTQHMLRINKVKPKYPESDADSDSPTRVNPQTKNALPMSTCELLQEHLIGNDEPVVMESVVDRTAPGYGRLLRGEINPSCRKSSADDEEPSCDILRISNVEPRVTNFGTGGSSAN